MMPRPRFILGRAAPARRIALQALVFAILKVGLLARGSGIVSSFPGSFIPGTGFTVTNTVSPDAGVFVYAVEDVIPVGWSAGAISDAGTFSAGSLTVQWGPFFDNLPRVLTYVVTPPAGATGTALFTGDAVFNLTETDAITGQRSCSAQANNGNQVISFLPPTFFPGAPFLITNQAIIVTGVQVYAVTETLPSGWTATDISSGGAFDGATGEVRWGPFFDDHSRSLTYTVIPPASALAAVTFVGRAAIDGVGVPITGWRQTTPSLAAIGSVVSSFPPEFTPGQWFTVTNRVVPGNTVSLYAVADTVPAGWAVANINSGGWLEATNQTIRWGPFAGNQSVELIYSVLPPASLNLAGTFSGSAAFDGFTLQIIGQRQALALAVNYGAATCHMPVSGAPGVSFTVTNLVSPASNTTVFAVTDSPPAGWRVSQISDQGVFDGGAHVIKWGPFDDDQPRGLSYQVTPAAESSGVGTFSGTAVFDGAVVAINGQRLINLTVPTVGTVVSTLPAIFLPTRPFILTDAAIPATNVTSYAVQDSVPPGWGVGKINHGGAFNPADNTVRWGPFFDALPRSLACQVTPPCDATTAEFTGTAVFDGTAMAITGQRVATVSTNAAGHGAVLVEQPLGTPLAGSPQVTFASQAVGTAGEAASFTVWNTGCAPLGIIGIMVAGGGGGDFILNTNGLVASLPSGGQAAFTVSFRPSAAGERLDTLQVLTDDAVASVYNIALSGTGVSSGGEPLLTTTMTGSVMSLIWQGPAGEYYQVLSSTNLQTWKTNVSNVTSVSTNYVWAVTNRMAAEFFRLQR